MYLTVKKLKEILDKHDDNLEIVLSSDDEGNNFRKCDEGFAGKECIFLDDNIPKTYFVLG